MLKTIFKLIGSFRFAILILVLITIACIFGTILPQSNLKYRNLFLFKGVGDADSVFHSYWFLFLLILLVLSLTTCAINRTIRFDKTNSKIVIKGKNTLRTISFLITHTSIIIILIGAVIGRIYGFNEYVFLGKDDVYYLKREKVWIKVNDIILKFNEKFMPIDYKSDISVFSEPELNFLKREVIEVNKPLIFRGVYYYQSSYGVKDIITETICGRGKEMIIITPEEKVEIRKGMPNIIVKNDLIFPDSNNPRAVISYFTNGKVKNYGVIDAKEYTQFMGCLLKIHNVRKYTGIKIKKDPGILLVWIGFIFLSSGIIASFIKRLFDKPESDSDLSKTL